MNDAVTRVFVALFVLLLGGCSLPRIIILNDPLDARQHNDLGVSYEARGEYDLAKREYLAAAEDDKDWARPLINLGNVAAAQQKWAVAAGYYRDALDRDPEHEEAMNNLAWALLQIGQTDQALHWVQQALDKSPDDPNYLDTLAEIQLARGDTVAAAATLHHAFALELTPEERRLFELKQSRIEENPH